MYEQDWLSGQAMPMTNLTDPNAFMQAMATGAAGQTVMMSMHNFLYTSRLARSMGVWPWSDVFMSGETNNLLLATLSAGMVGVGDAQGSVNAANLLQSIRSDGVIVKPDESAVPLDSTYTAEATARAANTALPPMVAAAQTDHGAGMLANYVVAYPRGGSSSYTITPAQLGVTGAACVYDYFAKTGAVVPAGQSYTGSAASGFAYDVVVPVGASRIGFVGGTGQFATLGRSRIPALSDSGVLQATVTFAARETAVQLGGYSPTPPVATVNGIPVVATWDPASGLFSFPASPDTERRRHRGRRLKSDTRMRVADPSSGRVGPADPTSGGSVLTGATRYRIRARRSLS